MRLRAFAVGLVLVTESLILPMGQSVIARSFSAGQEATPKTTVGRSAPVISKSGAVGTVGARKIGGRLGSQVTVPGGGLARKPLRRKPQTIVGVPVGASECVRRLVELASEEPVTPYERGPREIINNGLLWDNPKSRCWVEDPKARLQLFGLANAWRERRYDVVRLLLGAFSERSFAGGGRGGGPIAVRVYVYGGRSIEGLGGYAYLLLGNEPSDAEKQRYDGVCNSFKRILLDIEDFGSVDWSELMVTQWPLKDESLTPNNCSEALGRYDYATANLILRAVNGLSAKGPILCAFRRPFSKDPLPEEALVFDLSRVGEEGVEDLDMAFRVWKDQISRKPECWKDGFNWAKIKLALVELFNKYGDDIVKLIKPNSK